MRTPFFLLLVLGATGLPGFVAPTSASAEVPREVAVATETIRDGFAHLARQRFPEALQAFREHPDGGTASLEAKLGRALALLGAPPVTPGKIAQAEALLRELASGDSEVAVAARFQGLRLAQYFRADPDHPALRDGYLALFAEYPLNEYGQRAALSAALLELYALPAPDRGAVVDRWDRKAGELGPIAPRLHLLLAAASADLLRDDRRAVRHLREVEAAGAGGGRGLKQVRVRLIGALAALGEPQEAEPYYRRLAADYPHDVILPVLRTALDEAAGASRRNAFSP